MNKSSNGKKYIKSKKSMDINPTILYNPRQNKLNLPKIKSKEANLTATNIPGPIQRILSNINQILDEDIKDDIPSTQFKESLLESVQSLSERMNSSNSFSTRDENNVLISEISRLSFTSNSDVVDTEESDSVTGDIAPKTPLSNELKRRVIRNCLDLKRLLDKESIPILTDSPIQKTLFSKSSPNITEFSDVDTTVVITNLIVRLVNFCEGSAANISLMAKKNLCPILLQTVYSIHQEHYNLSLSTYSISSNMNQRIDEVYSNSFQLLAKLAKYEPKISLLARIHGTVNIAIKTLRRCVEKRDNNLMMSCFNMLKIFASKNDNNLMTIQKSNLIPLIETILKNNNQQLHIGKMENVLELLALMAKSSNQLFFDSLHLESSAQDLIKTFGMKFFLVNCTSLFEAVQKASLKVIRALNEFDFGKKAFEHSDGSKVLSELLNMLLQSTDSSNMSLTSVNSLSSLLVAALRSAAGQTDLPFLDHYKLRTFPLPETKNLVENDKRSNDDSVMGKESKFSSTEAYEKYLAESNKNDCRPKTSPNETGLAKQSLDFDFDCDSITDDCAMALLEGFYPAIRNPPQSIQDLVRMKLRRLCTELSYLENKPIPKCESPNSNISVRHVQPMAPGKHFVCKNYVGKDAEPLLRRTPALFSQNQKGVLVYDVMDYKVAHGLKVDDGTLLFDSRFESGNLQLAIKVAPYEYDLLVQSDINSIPGKHNQWFYFSVKRMVPNVSYRFNILNLSKPASQFNNGMQPVMYSLCDPCWRRVGDPVFYIKKELENAETLDGTDLNTFSTLVFTVSFKHKHDTCYLAYHYPYTYSELQRSLYQLNNTPIYKQCCKRSLLCRTLGGNDCILLTITDFSEECLESIPISERKYIFLSARVHPGESNSSHIMNGLIQFLLSSDEAADNLRKKCVFKIIPMLNPDGVINGSKTEQTTIGTEIDGIEKVFSQILAQQSPIFDSTSCRFIVERSKETTARVVLRREFGIINSFTLESTYNGVDFGTQKGYQVQIPDLEILGADFGRSINVLLTQHDLTTICSNASLDTCKPLTDITKPVETAKSKSSTSSSASSTATTPKRSRKIVSKGKKPSLAKQMIKKKSDSSKGSKKGSKNVLNVKDPVDQDEPGSESACSSDDDDDGE
ncbi:Cytosolic carboxypeptidase 1 [Globomyces sp. JEL0801]|nr:Cytosolic carboxypeptidase 1 [Globomyces sp. JEL0801]